MTPQESELLYNLLKAVQTSNEALRAVTDKVVVMERAISNLHNRLLMQEAGTAMYEIDHGASKGAH